MAPQFVMQAFAANSRRREAAAGSGLGRWRGGVLATSAAARSPLHYYGSDYAAPTPKNLTQAAAVVLLKSALQAASPALLEYNTITERAHVKHMNGEREDVVDWNEFQQRHLDSFYKVLQRATAVESIKKVFEALLERIVSPKLFDRLTKLQLKSANRKLAKFKSSRLVAYKMFYTSLWSNAVLYTSIIAYEAATALYEYYSRGNATSAGKRIKGGSANSESLAKVAKKVVLWTGKRVAYYSIMLVGTASGFSVGFYFSPSYGVHVGPLLGEQLAHSVAVELGLGPELTL